MTNSPPTALLQGFGEDGLDVEVGFWIGDPVQGGLNVQSEVAQADLARFRAEKISMSFPQRDIRMVGGNPAVGRP